ncbi:MAG: hypothetical protein WDN28_28415 [Chthoniobacter sp.]
MSTNEPPFTLPDVAHENLFAPGPQRELFERYLLPAYIPRCRWFGGKARDPRRFTVRDVVPVSPAPDAARLVLVEVEYADQSRETYLLPLQILSGQAASDLAATHPQAILAQSPSGVLCDAIHDDAFRSGLFTLIAAEGTRSGEHGAIAGQSGPAVKAIEGIPSSRALAVEQSNSSVVYGDHIFLKLYRRLEHGMNPDAEILRFLSSRGFPHAPPFAGSIEHRDASGNACVLALATGLVPNKGDAWSFALGELRRWFEALLAGDAAGAAQIETRSLDRAAQLGTRTGEMHLALAGETSDPDFAAEPLAPADGQALAASILASARQVHGLISAKLDTLPEPARSWPAVLSLSNPFSAIAPKPYRPPFPAPRPAPMATTISARCSRPAVISSSSISKENPFAPWPPGARSALPSATSPACCAPSTTPRTPPSNRTRRTAPRSRPTPRSGPRKSSSPSSTPG